MINDHDNQHSNTYPFHGDGSDHLEKRNMKIWKSTETVGKNVICHVSNVIHHLSEYDLKTIYLESI